ncbi:MAG: FAD-dependent oxidoreductase [Halothece sp.]
MAVNSPYDILIIGTGPVGLATAVGLYQQGIENFLVIDQTRSFRKAGQVVDLLPNGLKAIKSIDPKAYQQLKSASNTEANPSQKSVWQRRNLKGEVTSSIPLDFNYWFQKYGEGRISISWYDLQTCLRSLLPSDHIQINTRCVNLSEKNDLVWVDCISNQAVPNNPFAHWNDSATSDNQAINGSNSDEEIKSSLQAKIVIAADGINSTVRQVLYQNTPLEYWAKPQYSGYAAMGCLAVENIPDEIINTLETHYFKNARVVTLAPEVNQEHSSPMNYAGMTLLNKGNNTLGYLLHLPLELNSILNLSPQDLINTAQEKLATVGYPDVFLQVLRLSDQKQLITRPYYIHPVDISVDEDTFWSCGRVVLIGDAAHGMPPFAAQGTNQGFEDALMMVQQLTKLFQNHSLEEAEAIKQIFQAYEKQRRPFMRKIQSATMNKHLWTQQQWNRYADEVYGRNL